jgi:hypothetical protein
VKTRKLQTETQVLLETGNEVGLEVKAKKAINMSKSHHQKAGQNHNRKIINKSLENTGNFKYYRPKQTKTLLLTYLLN